MRLSGNQLKIIALIAMTVDHVGYVLFPQYSILRIIGRLSFPIFAFMIAEGCYYTHDKRRYLAGIVGLGVLCQFVYATASGSLSQTILTTFALGIVTVYALQYWDRMRSAQGLLAVAGAVAFDLVCCFALPTVLSGYHFSIDYGIWGVLMPAFCYAPHILFKERSAWFRRAATLVLLAVDLVLLSLSMLDVLNGVQWWSLLTILVLALYSGKRGTWNMKHLFYVYYPLHLVVIWGIGYLL